MRGDQGLISDPVWFSSCASALALAFLFESFVFLLLAGGPGGATRGLRVFDIHAKRWHTHVPFAPIVSADTPARAKFGGFLAPAAFVACFHCEFEGHKYEDAKKGTYFAGYAHPSPLDVAGGGESVFAWDAPQKSDAVHRSNCREVEGKEEQFEFVLGSLVLPPR